MGEDVLELVCYLLKMKTVGQILQEARGSKFYTLEEVEKATKIRKELLRALEEDDYSKLPPPTFVRGFIKNYAKFLNLNPQTLLAIFRREFSERKHPPYVMESFTNPPKYSLFRITPARVMGVGVSLLMVMFFVYLWVQYRQFVGPPTLDLARPADQTTVDNLVVVEGKTDPEVRVMINNQQVSVNQDGSFRQEIVLSSLVNKITVAAISKFGQRTVVEKTVYLKK